MTTFKKRLPNLDAIRGIAALLVIVWHIELIKQEFGFSNLQNLHDLGGVGVTIFFVLSGILITHLLLQEHSSNGKISIIKFYMRRMLRIWPLYFLVLFIGVFIYPRHFDSSGLVMSILFLPNIAFVLGKLPALIDPIWSLGVEEQFYIFHPHIFRQNRYSSIFNSLLILLFVFYFLKFTFSYFQLALLQKIFFFARFDCMMLGAIFGMWLWNFTHRESKFKALISPKFIFSIPFQLIIYFGIVNYLVASVFMKIIPYNNQLFSLLVAFAITNLALNPRCIISIENKFLNFTGKISFGLYLTHKFPVLLFTWLATQLQIESGLGANLFIYGFSIPVSMLLAYFIFTYFEGWFLKIKEKKFSHN